jgi:UDP-glucose 4-epimerase
VSTKSRWCVVGGAGFIGSHFVDRLLTLPDVTGVTIFDNFSSGREWHFDRHVDNPRFGVIRGEVADTPALAAAMSGHQVVLHLASNPDIAAAMTNPDIDFVEGTALTRSVVEAMRQTGVPRILYASGSGVYGDLGELEASEDYGPLVPVSTYGASKLAGEALIASYAAMFGLIGRAFRFGNVVGGRQTHGVGFDFIRRLIADPKRLDIMGDGTQSKSYIHIDDVISAVLTVHSKATKPFDVFNVATGDYITVGEIADLAVETLGLSAGSVEYHFSGGSRGWKGDVPIVRLDTRRMRSMDWRCERTSRDALSAAMRLLIDDARAGRL